MADDDGEFPPAPLRRRLLVALLAVATAVTLFMLMLERVGAPEIRRPPPAGPTVCTEGQLSGCLGGKAEVIVVPAAAAAPDSAGSGR